MSESRTKNAVRNTVVSVGGYLLYFVFGIIVRKLFLQNLSIENLGYEGIFGSIFQILNILDLGAGALLTYRLYRAIAHGEEGEVARLMAMFAWLYRVTAVVILAVGAGLAPFLRYIIRDNIGDWAYVYFIYFIQLFGAASISWLSYYRLFLEANQRASDAAITETVFRILGQVGKALVILLWKDYILYLLVTVLTNFLTVLVIAIKSRRKYPYAFTGRCSLSDFKEPLFLSELKNGALIKALNAVYYLTDTVLISAMAGLRTVALYGNYTMIGNAALAGFQKVLQPVNASVGNYVHTNPPEECYRLFRMMDLLGFYLASFAFAGFFTLFQPVLSILYGKEYLLETGFVLFYAMYFFFYIKDSIITTFRSTVGYFDKERIWAAASAGANLILSIVLGKFFGLTGILIGTVASSVLFGVGKYTVAYRYCFELPVSRGLMLYGGQILLASAEACAVYALCARLPVDIGGILLRGIACVVLPAAISTLLFFSTDAFRSMVGFVREKAAFLRKTK